MKATVLSIKKSLDKLLGKLFGVLPGRLPGKFIGFGCVAVLLCLLQACADEKPASVVLVASAENKVSKANKGKQENYLVAVDAAYSPLVFRNAIGQPIGFDVDILNAIGQNQGFDLTFIPTLWKGIFDALSAGQSDVVAGGVTITAERQQKMAMSAPYIEAPTLIVYMDSRLNLRDYGDLKNDLKNLLVGVQSDTTFADELRDFSDGSNHVRAQKTLFLAFKALINGDVQAVIGDAPVLRYLMAQYGDMGRVFHAFEYSPSGQPDQFGFAVKKDNQVLLDKINAGLKNIKSNGEYEKIYRKWFESNRIKK